MSTRQWTWPASPWKASAGMPSGADCEPDSSPALWSPKTSKHRLCPRICDSRCDSPAGTPNSLCGSAAHTLGSNDGLWRRKEKKRGERRGAERREEERRGDNRKRRKEKKEEVAVEEEENAREEKNKGGVITNIMRQ